jgi:hypothetical protein
MNILSTNKIDINLNDIEFNKTSDISKKSDIIKHILFLQHNLEKNKCRLDKYKKLISDTQFSKILSIFNIFQKEKYILAKNINGNNITNAWLKCYEILCEFNIISDLTNRNKINNINHFDNASLPGSFILATHHYMKTIYPKFSYKWKASSLFDNNSKTFGDDYKLYHNYKNNWVMTKEINNNGDMTNIKCINNIVDKMGKNSIDLYTSDLGFSVDQDYNNQESLHYKANTGQIILCLKLLKIGGNCIIKHYTCFKPYTLSYLFLLGKLFEKVYITKPLTSKSSNSEVYIIGINYMNDTQNDKQNNTQNDKQNEILYKLLSLLEYSMINNNFCIFINEIKLHKFIEFIMPFLHNRTINQINSIINIDNVLSKISKPLLNDILKCKEFIQKTIDYDDINKFYKKCDFKSIKKSDKLNMLFKYN